MALFNLRLDFCAIRMTEQLLIRVFVFRTIQPRHGRMSAFTSGIENKHHVEPVTKGVRFALTMGFTCDKS